MSHDFPLFATLGAMWEPMGMSGTGRPIGGTVPSEYVGVKPLQGESIMKKFCLFLMTCVLVFLALLSTGCSVDDGVSAPNRICYGKKLYYDDVCSKLTVVDTLRVSYDSLCGRWLEESYDSLSAMYDPGYYIEVRECMDDVTFE